MTSAIVTRVNRPSWMTPFSSEGWGGVLFDRFWPEWHREISGEWVPTVNLYEKDGKYHLTAELPGLNKDDISVNVENDIVTVSGKKESIAEEKAAEYYIKETKSGTFSRSFRLPGGIDEEKIEATYKDGLLTVVITLKENAKNRKIQVH